MAMRGYSKDITIPTLQYGPADTVFAVIPIGFGFASYTIVDPASAGINKALDILKHVACGTAKPPYRAAESAQTTRLVM